jgi:hypothetical protein
MHAALVLYPRLGLSFEEIRRHHSPVSTDELVSSVVELMQQGE